MAWKWFKNDWSIAGFLLFFAQLAWVIYLISFVVFSIIFLIGITGMLIGTFATEPITFLDLPARFEIQDFAELVGNSQSVDFFESPILELNISSIGTELQYNWSYSLANIMILGLDGIILYGLTLLKRILRSLRREEPWSKQNSKNLRLIGYLKVLAVPYKYSIGWLSYLHHRASETARINCTIVAAGCLGTGISGPGCFIGGLHFRGGHTLI